MIREAEPNDVTFLRKMMWEAITASPALIKRLGMETIQQREVGYWQGWSEQPDPAFIAVDANGQDIGAIVLQPDDGLQRAWRIGIGVASESRGQGVGKRLIERAIAFAKTDGVASVTLSVDPGNTRAMALYEKMGFVRTGSRNSMIEMRFDLAS
jgi:ribosomal protein S18 acetylase RimI-like enzyme